MSGTENSQAGATSGPVRRVLHLSDVHVDVPLDRIPLRDWLGKRLVSVVNYAIRRRDAFVRSVPKLAELRDFAVREKVDYAIVTGDHTAFGTDPELAAARAALDPLLGACPGFAVIPGNHDFYTHPSRKQRIYERHFGDLMWTSLPDCAVDGPWPMVRLLGEHAAIVAVNSARPNRSPIVSSGVVPPEQLEALRRALDAPELLGRFVFVLTHYGPRLPDGSPDGQLHGMVNAEDFLKSVAGLRFGAVLHGHIHHRYHLDIPEIRVPTFCAGSTTHEDREGLWMFEIEPTRVTATPGRYADGKYALESYASIEIDRPA